MKVIVTGVCGFIGYNLVNYLLKKKITVYGIDNIDDYYSTKYKKERLKYLKKNKKFKFLKVDISKSKSLESRIKKINFDQIIHLAAQPGVRYSFINPRKYINSNVNGFFNILEIARKFNVKKIIYGSSSSVYGDTNKFPITEKDNLKPISTYSLTKKLNEELASMYSKLYNLNLVGLRFFTVYGECGRPDMFLFKFLKSCIQKKSFQLYNGGDHYRDFTYVGDVIHIIWRLMNKKTTKKNEIFNISAGSSLKLRSIINEIEKYIELPKLIKVGFQRGDVKKTHGSNKKIKKFLKKKTFTNYKDGIKKTTRWYFENYKKFYL